MNGVQIALSFATVMGLFGVIFIFLVSISRLLERTALRLTSAAATVGVIRDHTSMIEPAVQGMNQGLYVVAANLLEVGALAEARESTTGT